MKPGNIKRKAFTLVEILIVICVISILFVVLISRVDFATDKSRQAGVQNDFHAMQSALHVIALENNSFIGDITQLADELNKNLDSELSVRVENGVIKTDAKDPWGSEYVLEYDKPTDTNGRVTLLSPGPDTTLKTQDDIKSEVVIKVDNGKTNIVIDNKPQEEVGGGEHTCLFNRMVKESQYIKTHGNCITPTVYYYSCSCGAVGTSTFHGSLALDEHIGTPRIEYQAFDANHNVLSYCSSCNVLISTVPEAHNMVNEECTLCHKVIHNHNYNLELVSEAAKASSATCTAKATYYYSCQCGALSTDTFEYGEVRAHTFTGNSTQYKASDATCSVRATYYRTCSSCGIQGTETFESGLADGPHPGTTIPTYVKLNETQHTKKNICTACSNEVSSTTENHNLNENNTCSLCNEHVHNYTVKHVDDKHIATPASCTAAAKYYYSCTCDENGTTTFDNGTALSHNEFGEVVEDKYFKSNATCLTPTIYYKSCTGCGLKGTSTFTVGQPLGHIEVQTQGYAATCTTTGLTDGITCSRCNEIVQMQMIINALGHEEVITKGKEATCTTSGVTDKVTCSRCNTIITNSTTIAALGHDIVYDEGYAATCSKPGLTTGERCSRCDYKITQQEIAKLPHIEVIDNAVPVTCTTNGYTEGKHCSVCGEATILQETIYATGHAEVKLNAIAATCTSSGLTEGSQCSKCGSVLKAQTSIAAKGHTVVQDSAIAATCTREGKTAGSHCSVCNVIISGTSTIAKLDHNYDVEITNPQCLVDGYITYTCNVCNHTYQDLLSATGHVDKDGNNICDICDKTVSSDYILTGKWKFLITPIITGECYQEITFTSNNEQFFGMATEYEESGPPSNPMVTTTLVYFNNPVMSLQSRNVIYGYSGRSIQTLSSFEDDDIIIDGNIDFNTNYQIIDFGTEPQKVTEDFFMWFTCNAIKFEEDNEENNCMLSGKWTFNTNLTFENVAEQYIQFTSNGTQYNGINVVYTEIQRPAPSNRISKYVNLNYIINYPSQSVHDINPVADYSDSADGNFFWIDNSYQIVDFGSEPQKVTSEFYSWFISNAIPQSTSSCGHDVFETIVKPASCSEVGIKQVVCPTCKTSNYITISKLDHTIQEINEIKPTCTKTGMSAGQQCMVCDTYLITPSTIRALGHNFETQFLINATCLENGFKIDNCQTCGEILETTLVAPGHKDIVKDGYCDICNEQIKYTFTLNNETCYFTYNMTWNDWLSSEFNTTNLVAVGDSILEINEEKLICYKLISATVSVTMNGTSGVGTFYQPKPTDVIQAGRYLFAQPASNSFIINKDGDFLSGNVTYRDIGEGLKNGEIYVAVLNGQVFYNHEDALTTVKITHFVNGYNSSTSSIVEYTFGDIIKLPIKNNTIWYYANEQGETIGEAITGNAIEITTSSNLICMTTSALELPFKENGTSNPLVNENIEVYDSNGKLVNKFKTNANGIAVIAGLKPESYICKSKYESWTINFINSDWIITHENNYINYSKDMGFNATMTTKRYEFTLTTNGFNGIAYIYNTDNVLVNEITTSNSKIDLDLVVGEYILRLGNQEQLQKLIVAEDGKISISPLQ